jgi:hypothetical protein
MPCKTMYTVTVRLMSSMDFLSSTNQVLLIVRA